MTGERMIDIVSVASVLLGPPPVELQPVVACPVCRGDDPASIPVAVMAAMDVCDEHAVAVSHAHAKRALVAILPPDVLRSRPEDVHPSLADWDPTTGEGVYLYGEPGRGKTWQAAILAKRAYMMGVLPVVWFPVASGIERIKASFRPGGGPDAVLTADLYAAGTLVLDDIGMEQATDWSRSLLYTLVNERMVNRRPTVYTSNLNVAALATRLHAPPIASRIAGTCRQVEVTGPDRRMTQR